MTVRFNVPSNSPGGAVNWTGYDKSPKPQPQAPSTPSVPMTPRASPYAPSMPNYGVNPGGSFMGGSFPQTFSPGTMPAAQLPFGQFPSQSLLGPQQSPFGPPMPGPQPLNFSNSGPVQLPPGLDLGMLLGGYPWQS